jgi:hypothetical protein
MHVVIPSKRSESRCQLPTRIAIEPICYDGTRFLVALK